MDKGNVLANRERERQKSPQNKPWHMNSNSVNFLSCSPKFAKDLVVQHSERQGGSLHPHPSTPHDAYHLLRGHCACLSSDRLRWLCNPLRHGPHSAHASLSVCALRHMQIFRQKGGRLRASVAASPWVLLRVGGGTGISEVVRLRVCGFVCVRACVRDCVCVSQVPGCSCPPTVTVTIRPSSCLLLLPAPLALSSPKSICLQ